LVRRVLLLVFLFFAILTFTGRLWLPLIGRALVHDEGPAKAEIAVVLAGDPAGYRIVKAAELVKQGFVPAVLVSGPELYAMHESDAAIDYAVKHGYPAAWFIGAPNSALSTREEAREILGELQRRNVGSFLLVTSDYHTARSARIYRATERGMGGGPEMRVVAAPDKHFHAGSWWKSREGLKTVFMEWSKTIATAFGM
jgi:uncharacterized SAM-binding protein YcdF (DUF218 family)